MKATAEDRLLVAAVNRRVQRRSGAKAGARVRCASCPQIVLDADPSDAERPWFCSAACFRWARDYVSRTSQTHKALPDLAQMPVRP